MPTFAKYTTLCVGIIPWHKNMWSWTSLDQTKLFSFFCMEVSKFDPNTFFCKMKNYNTCIAKIFIPYNYTCSVCNCLTLLLTCMQNQKMSSCPQQQLVSQTTRLLKNEVWDILLQYKVHVVSFEKNCQVLFLQIIYNIILISIYMMYII